MGLGHPRAPRGAPHRRASRSRPVRWARASPTPSAWRWPSAGCAPASVPTSSTTAPSSSPATAASWRACSHEAASLAGHQGLGRLVVVYDDNHITIDGHTELAYSDDAAARFEAYGWHVERLGEVADDVDALDAALDGPPRVEDRPVAPRAPQPHRLPVADQDRRPRGPRLRPLRRGDPRGQGGHRPPARRDLLRARRRARALPPRPARGAPSDRGAWASRLGRPRRRRARRLGRLSGLRPRSRRAGTQKLPTWPLGEKVATRKASGACLQAAGRRRARPPRRRRRPHRATPAPS